MIKSCTGYALLKNPTPTGITLLQEVEDDRPNIGVVIDAEGFNPGDTVFYIPHSALKIEVGNMKYKAVPISDIVCLYRYEPDQ
jgi:hypothetical protein